MPRDIEAIMLTAARAGVYFGSTRDLAIAVAAEFFDPDDAREVCGFIVRIGQLAFSARGGTLVFSAEAILADLAKPEKFSSARRCLLYLADQADRAIAHSQETST